MKKDTQIIEVRAEQLADKIESLITEARQKIASVANTAQVYTYYEIGRYIIEDEQGGKVRAEYGKGVLKRVSERLTERLGKGWSVDTLENARNFYNIYAKSEPVVRKSDVSIDKIQTTSLEISSSTEIRHQAGDEIGQQVADQLDGGKKSHQVGGQIGWFIKNDTGCVAISNESCGTDCYRTNSPRFILYSMRHHVYNFTKSNRRNEV